MQYDVCQLVVRLVRILPSFLISTSFILRLNCEAQRASNVWSSKDNAIYHTMKQNWTYMGNIQVDTVIKMPVCECIRPGSMNSTPSILSIECNVYLVTVAAHILFHFTKDVLNSAESYKLTGKTHNQIWIMSFRWHDHCLWLQFAPRCSNEMIRNPHTRKRVFSISLTPKLLVGSANRQNTTTANAINGF